MGNCVSASTLHMAPKITVVQASQGCVVDVELPTLQSSMKVGELMLEFPPGHFVAQLNQADLFVSTGSKRAAPLGADIDAKPGAVYVLFPMPRMHSRINPKELLAFAELLRLHDQVLITKAAHNPSKVYVHHGLFKGAGARVAPLIEVECKDADLQYSCGADISNEHACPLPISFLTQQSEQESISYPESASFTSSCHGHSIGPVIKPKPWAPALETIMESS